MKDSKFENSELVEVFVAPDELLATMVRDMLVSEGIDAAIRNDQISWYDSIAKVGSGYWGKVFVRSEDERRAKELVAEFMRVENTRGEETADDEKGAVDNGE